MYVSITLFISGYMIILQNLIDSIESSNLQFDELRVTERNIAVIAWLIRKKTVDIMNLALFPFGPPLPP